MKSFCSTVAPAEAVTKSVAETVVLSALALPVLNDEMPLKAEIAVAKQSEAIPNFFATFWFSFFFSPKNLIFCLCWVAPQSLAKRNTARLR